MKKKIGITTTIPQEVVYAAGYLPCDLNNLFINSPHPGELVRKAEGQGFPANSCSWIKGLYTVAKQRKLEKIIAVTTGDCSNTKALMEVLASEGMEVIPFGYPPDRSPEKLKRELDNLIASLETDWEAAGRWKTRLDKIRRRLSYFDRLCQTRQFHSLENHLWLVKSSDLDQDPDFFEKELDQAIQEKEAAEPLGNVLKIGYMGVPPITPELYGFIDSLGTRIVYNEVQRQFSMPTPTTDLIEQYLNFTYPYDLASRIADIKEQIHKRGIQGIIHYTQSFCHRQIEDIVIRRTLKLPVLTLEIDNPGGLDGQTKTRIEGFIELCKSEL